MAVASASQSAKKRPGSSPSFSISHATETGREGPDGKPERAYKTVGFLFEATLNNKKAFSGAKIDSWPEGGTLVKSDTVKYYMTQDKEGNDELIQRVKKSAEDERGTFSKVVSLKKIEKNGKVFFVGNLNDQESLFIQPYSKKK